MHQKKWNNYLIYIVCIIALSGSGCPGPIYTTQYEVVGNPNTIAGLKQIRAAPKRKQSLAAADLRKDSLRDYALSLGAQIGCVDKTRAFNHMLYELSEELDRIFNFNALLLDNNVLPPVLMQGEKAVNLVDQKTMRIADRTYRIYSPAVFVTVSPNWRTYLIKEEGYFKARQVVNPIAELLPHSPEEQLIWEEAIKEGEIYGAHEATTNFLSGLNALYRDFSGMILYHQLLRKGMVTKPYVAHINLGVTGDANTMHIHDQVLSISVTPTLQHDTKKWRSIISGESE
jgi:defect-in-organelle-trafficking protein DotC